MGGFRKAAIVLSIALLVVYCAVFFQLRDQLSGGYSDFVSFYTAGTILERGSRTRLYDIQLQSAIQREIAPNVEIRQLALPFVRPAFEAWLFWPLARLSYRSAFVLWNLLNCGCLILAVLWLRNAVTPLQRISRFVTVVSSLAFFPVFLTLLQGQDSILILLVYVLAYKAFRRNRDLAGGMTLGLGICKFPLVIPFLVPFVVRGRLRVVSGFAISSLLLAAASIATVGVAASEYYPRYILNIDTIAQGVNRPRDMTNLRGLLAVLLPGFQSTKAGLALLLLGSILLIGLVVYKCRISSANSSSTFALAFSLDVVITVLVSYHCHAFDLCLLLLPIAILLGHVLSDLPAAAAVRKFLVWTLCICLFSPLYILLAFTLGSPGLLALLVAGLGAGTWVALANLNARDSAGAAATPQAIR